MTVLSLACVYSKKGLCIVIDGSWRSKLPEDEVELLARACIERKQACMHDPATKCGLRTSECYFDKAAARR
jgi:hypothetical protein